MIFVIPSLPKNDMNIHIVSVHDGKSLLNVKCVNPQVVKINQTAIFFQFMMEKHPNVSIVNLLCKENDIRIFIIWYILGLKNVMQIFKV